MNESFLPSEKAMSNQKLTAAVKDKNLAEVLFQEIGDKPQGVFHRQYTTWSLNLKNNSHHSLFA